MNEIKKPFFTLDALTIIDERDVWENCDKHGKYMQHIITYKFGNEVAANGCPECERLEDEKLQKQLEEKERQAKINLCKQCNIEPEYYFKTLDDYETVTESQKQVKAAAQKMLDGKINKLVLLGGNGTGKTMIGSVLAKMYNYNGKIYSMYEITTMIRQSYTVRAEKSELEIVQELASIPFLAIDEMGRTKGSDSEKNWLSYILDKRHVRNLPFVLISNGHLRKNCKCKDGCEKCFENYMDLDIISRLRQNSEIINVSAPDYRAKH